MRSAARPQEPEPEPEPQRTQTSNEDEDEDITCCHRITICHPLIRDILVTSPVFKRLGLRLTWANLFWIATSMGMVLLGWAVLYFLLDDVMLPKRDGFGLYVLVVFSYFLGWSLYYIPWLNLPPVVGMLLAGVIVRNTGLYDIHEELGVANTSKIRTFCLTFIVMRAGLQLSTTSLRRHPLFIMIVAILPCTVELFVLAIIFKYILQYPWDWAFMTGAILACMSPVVTVNCVLALAEKGYGEDKGIASVLCTAACIDDVHVVSVFAVCYSIVFADEEARSAWWFFIPPGLRDFTLGIMLGVTLGTLFVFFPHRSYKYVIPHRMIFLALGSLLCTTSAANLAISGGGYLASLILSFIAITGWRILSTSFKTTPFRKAAYIIWHLMQPILVGVIGADIDFTDWSLSRFGLHLLCIFIGLLARSIVTFLTTFHTSFTWKERLFFVVAWLPKGTLQAALGPMAYERVRNEPDNENIELALDVVRVSVVAILFLAPIGAFSINTLGPILLNQVTAEKYERDRALSYLRILSLQPFQVPGENEQKLPISTGLTHTV
ncbi:sodium/hydrogen exchanger 9B1 [Calliopsis andreniformis]|uniref:sodium/hydrogen exchanger 9B1 n=1 Tax=Calliopsis andreniformis TaxID=337506 RepID=UPI003FCE2584